MSQDPKKFPLFRLPMVAAEHLIRTMRVAEMFILSLTSTRAKTLLNYSLPKNHAHLHCLLYTKQLFVFKFPPDSVTFHFKQEQDDAKEYSSYKSQNVVSKLFLGEPMEVISARPFEVVAKAFLTRLAKSFHTPKISMDFGRVVTPEAALRLLNHAKSLNLPMERIELGTKNTPVEIYRAFLNVGPITKELFIASAATPDFQYSPSEVLKLDIFQVEDGHWVHLQDFMECKSLVVINMTAKPNLYSVNGQKFNEFFKVWQRSSCRLEHLDFWGRRYDRLNFEQVIMGLNSTNFVTTNYGNNGFQSVDIEREDGRKATIRFARLDGAEQVSLKKKN